MTEQLTLLNQSLLWLLVETFWKSVPGTPNTTQRQSCCTWSCELGQKGVQPFVVVVNENKLYDTKE